MVTDAISDGNQRLSDVYRPAQMQNIVFQHGSVRGFVHPALAQGEMALSAGLYPGNAASLRLRRR